MGGAIAHHHAKRQAQEDYAQEDAQAPVDNTANTPPPADPADQIEHLAQLHSSGALTDDEFAAAKAKVLEPS